MFLSETVFVTFDIFVFSLSLSFALRVHSGNIFPKRKARAKLAINQMKLYMRTLESRGERVVKEGSCIIAAVALCPCTRIVDWVKQRSPTRPTLLRVCPWSIEIKEIATNRIFIMAIRRFLLRHKIIRTLLLTQFRLQSAKCVSFYDDGVIKKQLSAPTLSRENKFLSFRIVERLVECLEK